MSKNNHEREERYPLEGSTDLIEALAPIFDLLGNYRESEHETRMHYLSSLGRPAIEEIARRFNQVLSFGCEHGMDYFKFPQTRTQDHYKKGETLWYIPNPDDPRDDYRHKTSTVSRVDSWDTGLTVDRYDLCVFFDNGDIVPLRSIRVLSKKEINQIYQNGLLPKLQKALPPKERPLLQHWKESINTWTFPQKKNEVKNLVSVLLQRQDQVAILPKSRQHGHYKAGDLIWYFPNDLYDRDMRGADDEEYAFHFGQIEEVVGDGLPKGPLNKVEPAYVKVAGRQFELRSSKIFSCEEILRIYNENLFDFFSKHANMFENMMPDVLHRNIGIWLEKARKEFGVDNLEDYFTILKTQAEFKKRRPTRI